MLRHAETCAISFCAHPPRPWRRKRVRVTPRNGTVYWKWVNSGECKAGLCIVHHERYCGRRRGL